MERTSYFTVPSTPFRSDSVAFYPVKQAAPWVHAVQLLAGRVICWQRKSASFRQKTCGIKCHGGDFIPLSRVPAFASIAFATASRPFQSGLGLVGFSLSYKMRRLPIFFLWKTKFFFTQSYALHQKAHVAGKSPHGL